MRSDDLDQRIDRMATRLADRLKCGSELSVEQQKTASELVSTLPYLTRLKSANINVMLAELALEALISTPSKQKLAEGIVEELARRRDVFKSVFRSVWEGGTVASSIVLGLMAHVVSASVVFWVCALLVPDWRIWVDENSIWPWVFIGGCVGGVASLLGRLHDFAVMARWAPEADPRLLFYTGLLKPVLSIIFAFFVWTSLKSGIVSLSWVSANTTPESVFALAFIAGFSERLAPDIANRTVPS